MAEVRITTKRVIALILTEAEAKWLKGVLQNPLNGSHDPTDEDIKDKDMRHEIFRSLDGAGV